MAFTISNINDYQNRLTSEQEVILVSHSNSFNVEPNICAWYDDMDDFYSDWCDEVGYSIEMANDVYNGSDGEFLTFNDGSIIRLVR